ncbi:MAG: lipid-binding protein [Rikenellaceae bacterium]
MKKYIVLIAAAIVGVFSSCSVYTDAEPGGTAVEKMAGTWTVTILQNEAEYMSIFYGEEDPNLMGLSEAELDAREDWSDRYGMAKFSVITSNTAANTSDEMLFVDNNFWGTTVKCSVDYQAGTFECIDAEPYEGCVMSVLYGKIVEDGAVTPSGRTVDSITAYVKYSDDGNGFTLMKLSGYRYTGYTEDLF